MSPLRPNIRCSARLRTISTRPMASSSEQHHRGGAKRPPGNSGSGRASTTKSTRGGSKGKTPARSSQQAIIATENVPVESPQLKNISWDASTRTDILVDWLLSHPSNQRILFSDKNLGGAPPSSNEGPVGHNKKEVQSLIAEAVFKNDSQYKDAYAAAPAKFQASVGNRITT